MNTSLLPYSLHDYARLLKEWKALARKFGLKAKKIGSADGFPLWKFFSPTLGSSGGLYISAGIHGDEPAGCHGLLQWARLYAEKLAQLPVLIFPCLNPWGLVHNLRTNASGLDLNRAWASEEEPLIQFLHLELTGMEFSLSLHLHEDFDAHGIYLYEPKLHRTRKSLANQVLEAAEEVIPRDPRVRIDRRKATHGIIRPALHRLPPDGLPEALYLSKLGSGRGVNLTLETPSEWGFEHRIDAHVRMVNRAVQLCFEPNAQ